MPALSDQWNTFYFRLLQRPEWGSTKAAAAPVSQQRKTTEAAADPFMASPAPGKSPQGASSLFNALDIDFLNDDTTIPNQSGGQQVGAFSRTLQPSIRRVVFVR